MEQHRPVRTIVWAAWTLVVGSVGVFVSSLATAGAVSQWPAVGIPVWTALLLAAAIGLRRAWSAGGRATRVMAAFRVRPPVAPVTPGRIAAGALGAVGIIMAGTYLLSEMGLAGPDVPTDGGGSAEAEGIRWAGVVFVAVVLAPLVEELWFRGFVQRRLEERMAAWAAVVLSAAAFGLYHLAGGPMLALLAGGIGVIAGALAWRSQSVVPAILVHAAWNGTLVAFEAARRAGLGPVPDPLQGLAAHLVLAVGGVALLCLAFRR